MPEWLPMQTQAVIPLRQLGEKVTGPGRIEVDTVVHHGDSMSGTFAWTVTMTDRFKNQLEAKIELYRSRPYKKNDSANIEQKNQVFVRELFGYSRIESPVV